MEQKAKEFSKKCHEGQFRKDGKTPYFEHPKAVVDILKNIGVEDEEILSAAWLHDVIEDCGITKKQLEREFNPNVARIVQALTRDCSGGEYNKKIIESDYSVKIIKIADVVHNILTLHNVSGKSMRKKIEQCLETYFKMAEEISPELHYKLRKYTLPYIHFGKGKE